MNVEIGRHGLLDLREEVAEFGEHPVSTAGGAIWRV